MKTDRPTGNVSGRARDVLLVIVIAILAVFATLDDLRRLPCTAGDRPTRTFKYPFGAAPIAGAPMVLVADGCTETVEGIFVPPHGNCQVNIWLTRDRGERGRILFKMLHPDRVSNALMIQEDENRPPEVMARDKYLTDALDLPIRLRGSSSQREMILSATNQNDTPARIVWEARYWTFADATVCLVDFPRTFAAWGAVIFCAVGMWQLRTSKRGRGVIAVGALAMVASSLLLASNARFWIAIAFVLFFLYWATRSFEDCDVRRSILTTAALWAIGLIFIHLRFPYLAAAVNARLDPDAGMYRLYADQMSLFSQTGFFSGRFSEREPLFIFVAHAIFKFFGSSDLHLRYASFLSSLPIPFLTYWIARRAGANRSASLLSSLAVSIGNPYLRVLPSRGLRDDLFMTVSAALILTLIVVLRRESNWRFIAVAVAGVVCMWTRTPALTSAIALFFWFWLEGILHRNRLDVLRWARRWRIWEAAACLVIIYVSFVPIRFAYARIYGHSDSPERGYARWLANVEFQDRLGTPGFPSKEDYQRSSYSGPPITIGEYLFRLHTPAELAVGTVRGTVKAIADLLPDVPGAGDRINRGLEVLFGILLIGSFCFARSRAITMAGLSGLSYAGFFYDRHLIELRSAAHAILPFTAAALMTADLGIRAIRRSRPAGMRAWFANVGHSAAPNISTTKASIVALCLGSASAAAAAGRNPQLGLSPNALCLALSGFYWKAATVVSWPVAASIPLLIIVIAIAIAVAAGVRWWAAVAVAIAGGLIGVVAISATVFSGPTPRTYLWQKGDTVERSIQLSAALQGRPARLHYYIREPFRTAPSQFSYRIEINDQPLFTSTSNARCSDCIGFQWREIPIPAAMLAGKQIAVRFRTMTDGDQTINYVDLGRIPFWRLGTSAWNGNERDLSPDPGQNGGTLMIGLTFPRTASQREIPLWLGR